MNQILWFFTQFYQMSSLLFLAFNCSNGPKQVLTCIGEILLITDSTLINFLLMWLTKSLIKCKITTFYWDYPYYIQHITFNRIDQVWILKSEYLSDCNKWISINCINYQICIENLCVVCCHHQINLILTDATTINIHINMFVLRRDLDFDISDHFLIKVSVRTVWHIKVGSKDRRFLF